jgi:hypothetical protein
MDRPRQSTLDNFLRWLSRKKIFEIRTLLCFQKSFKEISENPNDYHLSFRVSFAPTRQAVLPKPKLKIRRRL